MRPLFFGSSEKPLFGVFHPPAGGTAKASAGGGVLVCNPFGREYLRAHRALRELAESLSGEGFTILRFDNFGCGDSSGQAEEADLPQWIADVADAAEELSDSAATSEIAAVGLRLGAALCTLASERDRIRFSRLVLWEPVVKGARYLEELSRLQKAWIETHPPLTHERESDRDTHDVLGFPLPRSLREAIESVDLTRLSKAPARKVLIVSSESNDRNGERGGRSGGDHHALQQRLEALDVDVRTIRTPSQTFWLRHEGLDEAVVPRETIGAIARWFTEGSGS